MARPLQPTEPFGNMRFRVEVDGLRETRAVEVVFPEARIVAGGDRSPRVTCGALVLRRGVNDSREWYDWWDRARCSSPDAKRGVSVVLLSAAGRDAHRWLFRDCEPVAYQLSPLNALGNGVLIETLELGVGTIEMP